MHDIRKSDYQSFLEEIKEKIRNAQHKSLKAVNRELIRLYWDIGKSIVEKQEKLKWGNSVVEVLSQDLQKEILGIRGFSSHNLWRMRKFYLAYHRNEKLAPLVQEIGWSHNILIHEKCYDDLQNWK